MTHINTTFKKYINNGCASFDNPVLGRLYVQFKGYFIKPAVKFLSLNIVVAGILAKVGVVLRTLGSHVRLVEFLMAWENAAIAHSNDFVEFVLDYDGKQYEGSKMTMVMVMSWHY